MYMFVHESTFMCVYNVCTLYNLLMHCCAFMATAGDATTKYCMPWSGSQNQWKIILYGSISRYFYTEITGFDLSIITCNRLKNNCMNKDVLFLHEHAMLTWIINVHHKHFGLYYSETITDIVVHSRVWRCTVFLHYIHVHASKTNWMLTWL